MTSKRLLALLPLIGAAACEHVPPRPEVVWPDPPEKPRIRFVRYLASSVDVDDSNWADFRRFLTGEAPRTFGRPMGLAVSDDGNRLYVADYARAAVFLLDFELKTFEVFAPDEPRRSAFNVVLDDEENVYVTDPTERRVSAFDRKGKKLLSFGSDALERPTRLAIDRKRQVLYAVVPFGEGRQLLARGPIQAVFPFAFPRVAVFLETLHHRLESFRQESGIGDMGADGFYKLNRVDAPGAVLHTAVAGGAGPGGVIHRNVIGLVQSDIPQDFPGTVG